MRLKQWIDWARANNVQIPPRILYPAPDAQDDDVSWAIPDLGSDTDEEWW